MMVAYRVVWTYKGIERAGPIFGDPDLAQMFLDLFVTNMDHRIEEGEYPATKVIRAPEAIQAYVDSLDSRSLNSLDLFSASTLESLEKAGINTVGDVLRNQDKVGVLLSFGEVEELCLAIQVLGDKLRIC